ncbi:MAG: hypothetical protein NT069_20570 [Planctomycetota bacterium]|nr:hypothetical protein [Planctomycetota bacterium]
MKFFFNELSFHGQFHTLSEFYESAGRLMRIRQELRRYGSQLYCRPEVAMSAIDSVTRMQQAVQGMPRDQRQALMSWITQNGPFWPDEREHGPDEWLELENGEVVTDTALGEVAFRGLHGTPGRLVSTDPSDWCRPLIRVRWATQNGPVAATEVVNYWTEASVTEALAAAPPVYDSWPALEKHVRRLCDRLIIADDAFDPLHGHPYVAGAAEEIERRLLVLQKLMGCFNHLGERTSEGNAIFAKHFGHSKAWFTDSSDSEKNEFKSDLTFGHPGKPGQSLFCPWHGKVKSPQIRIHISWPIKHNQDLYVVYVGPKITKR